MSARHLYKVIFVSQGKVYEIYARNVTQGTLFGFIEVERLVFGERSTVVLDPSEERIKTASLPACGVPTCPCTPSCASTKSRSRGQQGDGC